MINNTILNKITKDLSDISNLQSILTAFCNSAHQTEDIHSILSLLECINEKTESLYLYAINLQNKTNTP